MYYLLIGYVQKWNSILEMGNKILRVIIIKFTSEELANWQSHGKERKLRVKFNCYQLYKKYFELIVQWEK